MSSGARRATGLAAVAALALLARLPLHLATHRLPVSNDDAIPLLIATHILRGELATILWNQPYNGTLDAYLLAPGLLAASAHDTFRAYEVLCAALLVLAIGALAARVGGPRAGWIAAGLAAVGTPYMALMAATGPTPNFLVPLLVAVPAWDGLGALEGARVGTVRAALVGLVAGAAVWDSALAVPALAGVLAGLLIAGLRPRPRSALAFLAGLAIGLSPLVVARFVGASTSSPVTAVRPTWLLASGGSDLARALAGLFGLQVPLVVDGPERMALPLAVALALGIALAGTVALGARGRAALPLLGWGAALAVAFALSRRTGGDEVRYLYGLTVPVLALAGAGLARSWAKVPAAGLIAAVAIAGPWTASTWKLAAIWSDPTHAAGVWQVPTIEPVRETLDRAGVRSAYASLQVAGRLMLESGTTVVVSQAWNERVPGDPLRFRDEVDLDPAAAWVLSPRLSRGMPRPARFRELLHEMGGRWHEDLPGELSVFRSFEPPFDEARPVPTSAFSVTTVDGAVLPATVRDRDPHTTWTMPHAISRGSGLVVGLDAPRRLSALALLVALDPTPLAARWICELDGRVVASGPRAFAAQWIGGVPRTGKQALLVVVLPGEPGRQVRLIFQSAGPPLGLGEVFLYGPDEEARARAGAAPASAAYEAARRGRWDEAVRRYDEALRLEPDRASYHAALVRAERRARGRRWLDLESLDDGGPELIDKR